MKAYSMDLRERVVAACDARDGTREHRDEQPQVGPGHAVDAAEEQAVERRALVAEAGQQRDAQRERRGGHDADGRVCADAPSTPGVIAPAWISMKSTPSKPVYRNKRNHREMGRLNSMPPGSSTASRQSRRWSEK